MTDHSLVYAPVAVSALIVLLNDNTVTSLLTLLATFLVSVLVAAVFSAVVGSLQSISILGFSVSLSDWGKRFGAITIFFATFFFANTIAGLGTIAAFPLSLGIILETVLIVMFGIGVMSWGWGETSGGTG